MELKSTADKLSMSERRKQGLLWVDTGENMDQQVFARGLCQDFNQTNGYRKKGGHFKETVCFLRGGSMDRTAARACNGKYGFHWGWYLYQFQPDVGG